jgi:HAD superfamily hydrolase (TIGR01549 family)
MLEAIFFDFDGVICDSVNIKTQAFAEMYKKYGDTIVNKVVKYHLENGGVSRFNKFLYWHKVFFNEELSEFQLQEKSEHLTRLVFDKIIAAKFIDGAIETLKLAKKLNIPLYIVSATPDEEINKIVELKGLKDLFISIHGSPKSKSTIVKEILSKNTFNPNRCLFIGDALSDYEAANYNNLLFLGVVNESNHSIFPNNVIVTSRVEITDFLD